VTDVLRHDCGFRMIRIRNGLLVPACTACPTKLQRSREPAEVPVLWRVADKVSLCSLSTLEPPQESCRLPVPRTAPQTVTPLASMAVRHPRPETTQATCATSCLYALVSAFAPGSAGGLRRTSLTRGMSGAALPTQPPGWCRATLRKLRVSRRQLAPPRNKMPFAFRGRKEGGASGKQMAL